MNSWGGTTWTGDFRCREVKTGFCRKRLMQTGSSGTLIGWKSGQTTFFPLWDRKEGAWLWTRISNGGRFKPAFAERDKCKPVLLGLSLAGNLVKPLLSFYGNEWRERGYGLWKAETTFNYCRKVKVLNWFGWNLTFQWNSLIGHSLKWRWCYSLIWPISLLTNTTFDPLGRDQTSFRPPLLLVST